MPSVFAVTAIVIRGIETTEERVSDALSDLVVRALVADQHGDLEARDGYRREHSRLSAEMAAAKARATA